MTRVGIDSGGTFTDCMTSDGHLVKLSSTPEAPELALEKCLEHFGISGDICHGTTVATNLIVQRKGARVGLLTTAGFEDVLAIRRQNRPKIYDSKVRWPEPLVPQDLRLGVIERIAADGSVLIELDAISAESAIRRLAAAGVESVAVSFLFAFVNPDHEADVAALVKRVTARDVPISLSSNVIPESGEYERTSATVLNAFVAPGIVGYLSKLEAGSLGRGQRVFIMNSNGGLIEADTARTLPLLTVLSGPAAGVVGARRAAMDAGLRDVITVDVGGTSTDVSVIPDAILETNEGEIAGFPLGIPTLDIETIGAGGGSIAKVDHAGILHSGPLSAGAQPGPACYGQGGPFTLTDANLLLGRIGDKLLDGDLELEPEEASAAGRPLADRLGMELTELAWAMLRIAYSNIERAIRRVSQEKGYDPRRFALVAFGGAGPQMACEVADGVGISRVLVPPYPGVMAAAGLLMADLRRVYRRSLLRPSGPVPRLADIYAELERTARDDLSSDRRQPVLERWLDVRYVGQSFTMPLPMGAEIESRFHEAHEARYGHTHRERAVEIVTARLVVTVPLAERSGGDYRPGGLESSREQARRRTAYFWDGERGVTRCETRVYNRRQCVVGREIPAPAIIEQYDSTTVVPPNWSAQTVESGSLLLLKP